MQPTQTRRSLVSAVTFVLAIVILVLSTINYLRITRIDYSPEQGVTEIYVPPTPTATRPTGEQTAIPATPTHAGGSNGVDIPQQPTATPSPSPQSPTLVPTGQPSNTTRPTATIDLTPTPSTPAGQTLLALTRSDVPVRDLYSIAARLRLKTTDPIPNTTERPAGNYPIGHSDSFYIADLPAKRYYTVTATIREVTDHAYWYAQDGRSVDLNAIKRASRTFESSIHPTNQRLFGVEWIPGVDNDPRITVLFASIPGAGGYFSSADEYTRIVNPYSNEREIIYVNTDAGWGNLESTLAHEYQHMIHWHHRPNHDVWLNEGAAMLAQVINGYTLGGVDDDFMREPDTQLNGWQSSPDLARANYGAAFLFLDFLRTYYGGDDIVRAVVAAPGGGSAAVDAALQSTGRTERFADIFERWTLANLLDGEGGASDAKLDYPGRAVSMSISERLTDYPVQHSGSVSQFGTDYIELAPSANTSTLQVDFAGAPESRVIASQAHSGDGIYWSNRGDLADTTLTRRFDLRPVQSASLDFYIWFDTEHDLDYGYVEASTDGGATWDTLQGRYTTAANPNGTNFGNGYTGRSADMPGADSLGWLHETIDLGNYAGKETFIRFEYITDDGYNAGGLAVDDISIEAIGWRDDAETNAGGWEEEGWVRVANRLPQTYYLAVVKFAADGTFEVQPVQVSEDGNASFNIAGPFDSAVIVVTGTTPYSIQKADYSLSVKP